MRGALLEIANLLESVHNAVGFPKEDKWNSFVCYDLEAVRKVFEAFGDIKETPGAKEDASGGRAQAHITNIA